MVALRDDKIKSLTNVKHATLGFDTLNSENICGVEFLTPIDSESIGIMVSGGADSTILLYYLMKTCPDNKIYAFTLGNMQRKMRNATHASLVVNKCIELTGNINVVHMINYDLKQTDINIFDSISKSYENEFTKYHYSGVTLNPPKSVTAKFKLPISETYRNTDNNPKTVDLEYRFFAPFARCNKSVIKKLYDEFGVMDDLFPLTRSCEYDPSITNDVFDPGNGHCGECWWCEERKWAFGRL